MVLKLKYCAVAKGLKQRWMVKQRCQNIRVLKSFDEDDS